jgi:hypothetical protein
MNLVFPGALGGTMLKVRKREMKAILIVLLLIGMVLLVLKIADEDAVKRMLERLKQTAGEELQQVLAKRRVVEGTIRPAPER